MKKKFMLLLGAVFFAAVFFGCSNDALGESSGTFLRQSTTAVSNLKATAYEGAIVLTWNYNADLAGGFRIMRTADGAETKTFNICETNLGENYYIDSYGDENQFVDGKSYKYTVYTLPKESSSIVDKSASASASAVAKIKRPSGKLEQWDKSEITAKWKEYDGETWVVVTRPDSYAYGYSATLTVDYKYNYRYYSSTQNKYVIDPREDSTTITTPTYTGLNSKKKDGKDGTAKDYYKIVKGSSWTNILKYTLSAAKSLSGASSQLGFYKDSDETNVEADKDTSIEDIGGNGDNGEVLASYVYINPDADNGNYDFYVSKSYVFFYKDETFEIKVDGRYKNSSFSKRTTASGTYTGNPTADGTVTSTIKKVYNGVTTLAQTEQDFFRLVSAEDLIAEYGEYIKESDFQGSATISDNATKLTGQVTYGDTELVCTRDK